MYQGRLWVKSFGKYGMTTRRLSLLSNGYIIEDAMDQIEAFIVELKDIGGFQLNIRAAIRGLWNGTFDYLDFVDQMTNAIFRGYEMAWREGSSQCGITPEERTVEEQARLNQMIQLDIGYIPGLADVILQNSKANGGKLAPLLARGKLWGNRYNAVVTTAQQVSCADQKFRWILGPTKIHCSDCSNYAGRVHRGSVWGTVGAQPQSRSLECGGWNCLCALSPTTDRASGGRPPRPRG